MDHPFARFDLPVRNPGGAGPGDLVIAFPDWRLEDEVRHAGFVLERDEGDASGSARPLADEDDTSHANVLAVADLVQITRPRDAELIELIAEERNRVGLQRQAGSAIVGKHLLHE